MIMTRTKRFSLQRQDSPMRLRRSLGFTLLELMIAVAIVAILARVAYASYIKSITKTRRAAAEACLMNFADYMERYYATNQRYDQTAAATPVTMTTAVLQALNLQCSLATTGTGQYYTYSFSVTPTQSTYTLQAVPQEPQATNDAQCGSLTLQQDGTKNRTGTASNSTCWQR
jgi:type IV pilus assembly protein PilE